MKRAGEFLVRLAAILIVAGILFSLPDPAELTIVPLKNAMVCLGVLIAIGVLIYNTLFFHHT